MTTFLSSFISLTLNRIVVRLQQWCYCTWPLYIQSMYMSHSVSTKQKFLTVVQARVWVLDVRWELLEDVIASSVGLFVSAGQFGVAARKDMNVFVCVRRRRVWFQNSLVHFVQRPLWKRKSWALFNFSFLSISGKNTKLGKGLSQILIWVYGSQ